MNLLSTMSLPGVRFRRNIAYRFILQLEDRKLPAHHRQGDVVDGHRADEPFVGPGVPVTVEDEVGAVLGDGTPEPVAAEEGPDPGRLSFDRRRGGRVVQQDDAKRAVGNGV